VPTDSVGEEAAKPAKEVITGFFGPRQADNAKPANEVIDGFSPEATLPEPGVKRPSGASEPYREMIELELRGAGTRWVSGRIWSISTDLQAPIRVFSDSCSNCAAQCSSARVWAELHEKAFRRLCGSPQGVVLDNLRESVCPQIFTIWV